jgi:hypothetical protein
LSGRGRAGVGPVSQRVRMRSHDLADDPDTDLPAGSQASRGYDRPIVLAAHRPLGRSALRLPREPCPGSRYRAPGEDVRPAQSPLQGGLRPPVHSFHGPLHLHLCEKLWLGILTCSLLPQPARSISVSIQSQASPLIPPHSFQDGNLFPPADTVFPRALSTPKAAYSWSGLALSANASPPTSAGCNRSSRSGTMSQWVAPRPSFSTHRHVRDERSCQRLE